MAMPPEGERRKIILVSGFGNTEKRVKDAHLAAARAWEGLGIETVIVHPDYVNGTLNGTVGEIRAKRREALRQGYKVSTVGSSGGGTILTAERLMPREPGDIVDPAEREITICSRFDLENYSEKYREKYPTLSDLEEKSPLLVAAAGYVQANSSAFPFSRDNTLCFTAGLNDNVVPPESSVLPGAKVQLLTGVPSHDFAVGAVLLNTRYTQRIVQFIRGE